MTQLDWTALVDLALSQVLDLPEREAAERLHVSPATVNRWRRARAQKEEITEPRGDPRDALLRISRQEGPCPGGEEGQRRRGDDEVPDLFRQVELVWGLEADEHTKILVRDSLVSGIRAQAALEGERARLQAEKARLEAERAARLRAQMLSQDVGNAKTRSLIAEAVRTGHVPAALFKRVGGDLSQTQKEVGAEKG